MVFLLFFNLEFMLLKKKTRKINKEFDRFLIKRLICATIVKNHGKISYFKLPKHGLELDAKF